MDRDTLMSFGLAIVGRYLLDNFIWHMLIINMMGCIYDFKNSNQVIVNIIMYIIVLRCPIYRKGLIYML